MRRALLVGIDDYPGQPLQGCVADAQRMGSVLSRHAGGAPNFSCHALTGPPAAITRAELIAAVRELFAQPADVAFLHFSGHGTSNSLGGYLVTTDAAEHNEGVPMADVLKLANDSPIADVVITLDCCHSGTFGSVPALGGAEVLLREGVSILTASRGDQASLEEASGGGVFTSLVVDALEGGAAGLLGETTAAGVYAYVDSALGAWDQRPLFKSHVSRFADLRTCAPRIERSVLHELTTLFPLPAEDLPLDPSYEKSVDPHDEEHERQFDLLQRLRHCGLVEPVGEDHMYYAAVRSKACRLTRLGRYYWRLVDAGKL